MGADQKRKDARKRKFEGHSGQSGLVDPGSQPALVGPTTGADTATGEQDPPKKKRQKSGSDASKPSSTVTHDAAAARNENADESSASAIPPFDEQDGAVHDHPDTRSQRFIIFIGNLPFTATDASIAKHFAKVQPRSIRHRTDKATGKSKGFAFLEFEAYDRMKTCLQLYHHSRFEDGESPARRLNVELTVGGGGGKSKDRKAKLREKNVKLNEERSRRAATAAAAEDEERKKKNKQQQQQQQGKESEAEGLTKKRRKHDPRRVKGKDDVEAADVEVQEDAAEPTLATNADGDIHPSRRSRMLHAR